MATTSLLEDNIITLPENTEWVNGELLEKYGDFDTLPQSFPLVAEVASPTDTAEDFFVKPEEYLQANCQEVWLIIPRVKYIFIVTDSQCIRFKSGDVARTQNLLPGFTISLDELLS